MSEIDIFEAMGDNAGDAATPPADLLERVESGYRRRRRGQVTATFLSVLLLAAGAWVAVGPPGRHNTLPAKQPVSFHIPASVTAAAPLISVWPHSFTIDSPVPGAPAGSLIAGLLDPGHLLIAGRTRFSSYDLRTQAVQVLVTDPRIEGLDVDRRVAISPHWIVWQGEPAKGSSTGGYSIFRAPITGGAAQRIGFVPGSNTTTQGFYATDEAVYWSPSAAGGVLRLSVADRNVSPVPGISHAWLDGTAWAKVFETSRIGRTPVNPPFGDEAAPVEFRNLVTGERRPVAARPAGTSMDCVPTFCLVSSPDSQVIQRLDGTGQISLDSVVHKPDRLSLIRAGDASLLLVGHSAVLDPLTGAFGRPAVPETSGCGQATGARGGIPVLTWWTDTSPSSGGCPAKSHRLYILTR